MREEIILVAAAVVANGWRELRTESAEVEDLSRVLRRLDLHPREQRPHNFRSPGSISRKASDIATAYSGYAGKPTRGGGPTRDVVREFESDPAGMTALASSVREQALSGGVIPVTGEVVDPDLGVPATEGDARERLHLARERDSRIRRAKLDAVRAAGGKIACEACGFDFNSTYGERGRGYIEVHHRVPLHVSGPTETSVSDLALLCSNCHRMVHRSKPWLTIEQLAQIVGAHRGATN